MSQNRFILLCGLPASGKSTIARDLSSNANVVVHSSDDLRIEMFGDINVQDKNTELFKELNNRIINDLNEGKDVIMDATNTSRKKRKALLSQLPKDVLKIALYVATPYQESINRNAERERQVPTDVMSRMYKTLQVPTEYEGWDKIIYEYTDDIIEKDLPKQFTDAIRASVLTGREKYDIINFLATYFEEFFKIWDMPHDSKYHSLSVSRHTYHVYEYILENYEDESDKELMLWTALLHDIGKAFCKEFKVKDGEVNRYANFIGHEYVGAQIAINFLKTMNFEDTFISKVALLIQYHMRLLNDNCKIDKLLKEVGQDNLDKLKILRDADNQAH